MADEEEATDTGEEVDNTTEIGDGDNPFTTGRNQRASTANSSRMSKTSKKSKVNIENPLWAADPMKLRPVEKTDEERELEKLLFFELPRKKCEQMAPELKRMMNEQKKSEQQHRIHILKRIMKRAKVKGVDEHLIRLTTELDKSEKIVPNGQVSKGIYLDIFHSRNFDLYGNLMQKIPPLPSRKFLELKYLAEQLGIEFTQTMDLEGIIKQADLEKRERLAEERSKRNIAKKKTEKWRIGYEEEYKAPVGLAKNPQEPFKSLGNEEYYSYDGDWSRGKMHGRGTYLFADGGTYEGEFEFGKAEGNGIASYPSGQSYTGTWSKGRYDGKGTTLFLGESCYSGEFSFGRRHGKGKLTFNSGLEYEGEFLDGKPDGRGIMTSKLTGWAWEGTFQKGSICGSGVLITPPPNSKRIIQYWPSAKEEQTLPLVVRTYLEQQAEEKRIADRKMNEIYGPLRGLQLKTYVNSIRQNLFNERINEKKQRFTEALQKLKEQKKKLHEARLQALVGDYQG